MTYRMLNMTLLGMSRTIAHHRIIHGSCHVAATGIASEHEWMRAALAACVALVAKGGARTWTNSR